MTNDELRALADALEPMAKAPRFEDFDVPGFCAWVRACADAKPVAKIERVAAGAIALFAPGGGPFDMSQHVGASLYAHPAPASPQAEPKRDERVIVRRAIAERLRALPKFEERGR